ncbi:uncharacterized protein LOC143354587 [Halictus rubicundus]|uniref:uncharacterized protein LOC143354587 n=1 Tax=Halictus rubicundus TaxID=77578 RepID=UPI0040366D95
MFFIVKRLLLSLPFLSVSFPPLLQGYWSLLRLDTQQRTDTTIKSEAEDLDRSSLDHLPVLLDSFKARTRTPRFLRPRKKERGERNEEERGRERCQQPVAVSSTTARNGDYNGANRILKYGVAALVMPSPPINDIQFSSPG